MVQYQTPVRIFNLVYVPDAPGKPSYVSIRIPLGKDEFQEVGAWEPVSGYDFPELVAMADARNMAGLCAIAFANQDQGDA